MFWDNIAEGCRKAAELGFDGVELLVPGPEALDGVDLEELLERHQLRLAAMGTGAGWVIHGLKLSDSDPAQRQRARRFIRSIIETGAPLGAPAVIGWMQGRSDPTVDRASAISHLRDGLNELGGYASEQGVPLLFEPLNRYETNLATTIFDGNAVLECLDTDNVRLVADLFHMNIEESEPAASIRSVRNRIGHVHFVDSNRQAAGRGHIDFELIAGALEEIGFDGYASAEALPIPDPDEAARQTIDTFHRYFSV